MRRRGEVEVLILVSLESTFQLAVDWSSFDISNGLLINRQNIVKNAIYLGVVANK